VHVKPGFRKTGRKPEDSQLRFKVFQLRSLPDLVSPSIYLLSFRSCLRMKLWDITQVPAKYIMLMTAPLSQASRYVIEINYCLLLWS
jgi:hypothetical protein